MKKKTVITNSAEETKAFGASLVKNLQGVNVIALHGELGSGKTTFAQGMAAALGIKRRIISPTFIIVRSYIVKSDKPARNTSVAGGQKVKSKNLFHVDLYRIQSESELEGLGIMEIVEDQENLVVIEWADKMGELLPEKRIDIRFEYIDEEKRKISITDC